MGGVTHNADCFAGDAGVVDAQDGGIGGAVGLSFPLSVICPEEVL